MNGDGNYYPEHVLRGMLDGVTMVRWCSVCSSEQATDSIEVEINGTWVPLDIGPECLTTLKEESRLDV